MNADDVLAYMASRPKRERPTELRSDAAMLRAWILCRADTDFHADVIRRHNLYVSREIDIKEPMHEHAIGNAWGHAVQLLLESKAKS